PPINTIYMQFLNYNSFVNFLSLVHETIALIVSHFLNDIYSACEPPTRIGERQTANLLKSFTRQMIRAHRQSCFLFKMCESRLTHLLTKAFQALSIKKYS